MKKAVYSPGEAASLTGKTLSVSQNDSASETASVAQSHVASSLVSDPDAAARHPLSVLGFGSARYGMLGRADPRALEAESDDPFETFAGRPRLIIGYGGGVVSDLRAGEHHLSVLIDRDPERGGRLFAHGLASAGRLGIGPARRDQRPGVLARAARAIARRAGAPPPAPPAPAPDFSALPREPPARGGDDDPDAMLADPGGPYQDIPSRVKLGKVAQVSAPRPPRPARRPPLSARPIPFRPFSPATPRPAGID